MSDGDTRAGLDTTAATNGKNSESSDDEEEDEETGRREGRREGHATFLFAHNNASNTDLRTS